MCDGTAQQKRGHVRVTLEIFGHVLYGLAVMWMHVAVSLRLIAQELARERIEHAVRPCICGPVSDLE